MSDPSRHDFFRRLRDQALAARQRRVVLLEGAADWYHDVLAALPAALGIDATRWFGTPSPGWTEFSGNVGEVLGRELELVGVDVRAGLDPDAFGALTGSLRAGGLLLLCGPPLETWPESAADGDAGRRFLARWARLLSAADAVTRLIQGDAWPPLPAPGATREPLLPDADGCLTADQRKAVDAVCRVVTGHRRRPVVLTADRGRGKSSAFGLAAAVLMRERAARVLVTGPSLAAVEPVFACAAARLPQVGNGRGALHWGTAELRFVAPDALVREPQEADLLLVDEAATLPVGLLGSLLERYARIAFATTVHGYEGSGRAFAVRFGSILERRTPGWRGVGLEEPVRWASGDPLEELDARLLLLDAEPATDEAVAQALPDDCRLERIDRDRLVADEDGLRELFGLLVLAHYRTRPRDLRQWLDGEEISLWGLRYRGHLVGVAVAADEGRLDAELAAAVGRGERRVRGHLIAQSLAAHLGRVEDAGLRGLRIVRIAVHPAAQGRGLGGRLLRGVAEAALEDGVDWVGASFGAEADLLRFWRASGFSVVRMGFTREATSGAHAALALRGLTSSGQFSAARAAERFAAGLPAWLGDSLRALEPELAFELLAQAELPEVGADALREAGRFARGSCEFEDALPWLRELCLARLGRGWKSGAVATALAEAMLVRLVQARSWAESAARLGFPGRAQIVGVLREGVAALLRPPGSEA
jgi:tRNA(Met) cytidine acetyltransferase